MLEFRHFEYGSQPQEQSARHELLLADPDWFEKDHAELETQLGEGIVEALGSLTTSLMLSQDGKFGGNSIVFSSEETPNQSNFIIVPSSVIHTSGLDPEKLRDWSQRLEDSVEDKPMTFEIVDDTLDDERAQKLIRIWFDGTRYGITRWGKRFDFPTETGKVVSGFAWDEWNVWDYNSEKRRQRKSELANIVVSTQELIGSINHGSESEKISESLCTLGLLEQESFIYSAKARVAGSGRDRDSITYQDILAENALGKRHDGSTMNHFDLLHDISGAITDKSQLAFVQYWFVTQGQREIYLNPEESSSSIHERLKTMLAEKIKETDGASNWDGSQLRAHIESIVESEASAYERSYNKYFGGHKFQSARFNTGVAALIEYPELNENKTQASIAMAIALADNPPSDALLEKTRELQRLQEDLDHAEVEGDEDTISFLEQQFAEIGREAESTYGGYFSALDKSAASVAVRVRDTLGIEEGHDSRAAIIDGILLAKDIVRIADGK